jgi:DNA-binding GntR family transcriptional regulator
LNSCDSGGFEYFRGCLEALGIRRLVEWDVMVFIYRHGASLVSAEQVSRLFGYSGVTVRAALDSLTSAGLIERSRSSNGVRFYRSNFAAAGDTRRNSLEEIMTIAGERPGRLLLVRCLHQMTGGRERHNGAGLHLA